MKSLSEPILKALEDNNANQIRSFLPEMTQDQINSALHHTIEWHGTMDAVIRCLVEEGWANLLHYAPEGFTPLHVACTKGHTSVALYLAEKGGLSVLRALTREDCDEEEPGGIPAHVLAEQYGHTDTAKQLLSTYEEELCINSHWGTQKQTMLHTAARTNDLDMVQFLLDCGAQVDALDAEGKNAILVALEKRVHFNNYNYHDRVGGTQHMTTNLLIIQTLMEHGACLDVVSAAKETALMLLCRCAGDADMGATCLLQEVLLNTSPENLEVNTQDQKGWTALRELVVPRRTSTPQLDPALVRLLVEKFGADVNVADKHGDTTLIAVCRWAVDEDLSFVRWLIEEQKASVNSTGCQRETPLLAVCKNIRSGEQDAERDCLRLIQLLIEHGADVDVKDGRGSSPLLAFLENEGMNSWLAPDVRLRRLRIIETLLPNNRSILNLQDGEDRTALSLVCHWENFHLPTQLTIVNLLTDKGADTQIPDCIGRLALHGACSNGLLEITRLLLLQPGGEQSLHALDTNMLTPFALACQNGHFEIVRFISDLYRSSIDLNQQFGWSKWTMLHAAVDTENIALATYLLEKGADPNVKNGGQDSPVSLLCRLPVWPPWYGRPRAQANRVLLLRMLLEHGADVSFVDKKGDSALSLVAASAGEEGATELFSLLLEHGADPNNCNKSGCTPLMIVCKSGCPEDCCLALVEKLLDRGATTTNKTVKNQESCLHFACRQNFPRVVEALLQAGAATPGVLGDGAKSSPPQLVAFQRGHKEVFQCLVEHIDFDVDQRYGASKQTLLHHCALQDDVDTALWLLEKHNADVNVVDFDMASPLHIACLQGCVPMVDVLVKHGADVNLVDSCGNTPLLQLCDCYEDRYDAVCSILNVPGINLEATNSEGQTALEIAVLNWHVQSLGVLMGAEGCRVLDEDGCYALSVACKDNHDKVRSMITSWAEQGVDLV